MAGSKRNKLKKVLPPNTTAESALQNDDHDELMDDLLAQLDSRNETVQSESAKVLNEMEVNEKPDVMSGSARQSAKNRFKARQERKAVALSQRYSPDDLAMDERMDREAKEEEKDINRTCHDLHLQVYEVNPDGHCLYSAIADQLATLGLLTPPQANYVTVRQAASQYMLSHPDDFIPFLPIDDAPGGEMTPSNFKGYCATISDTAEWGGEPEIMALSRAYGVSIHVIQGGRPAIVVHNPWGERTGVLDEAPIVRISYHRRMYGLGEHYNSLRPQGTLAQLSHKMQMMLSTN